MLKAIFSPIRSAARFLVLVLVTLVCVVAADLPTTCHKATFIREARAQWGYAAPVSSLAAQLYQESRCRTNAVSPVGARGAAQFMPATANWIPSIEPSLAPSPGWGVTNIAWDIRALITYDRWLFERVTGADPCQRMAKALRAYNGGLGWVQRDERLAKQRGINHQVNFDQLDTVNAGRSAAAFRENTHYPRVILLTYETKFIAAGFGPGVCT